MIRLIAVAGFALSVAVSAQAMTPAPITLQPDGMITKVAAACGVGRTRVNGVCVARTTVPSDPPSRPQMCDRIDLLALVLQWRPPKSRATNDLHQAADSKSNAIIRIADRNPLPITAVLKKASLSTTT
jgi:hypothetical protein